MPKREDIHTVLIIGAGPIVIGQACEFDYSGAQACKALRAEGYRVVLVNSNPATIMTDPQLADATYIEPITPEVMETIIAREQPNVPPGRVFALLPTMGGQTALNTALSLRKRGVFDKYNGELIGASADAIDKAEDRELFRRDMMKIGLDVPRGVTLKGYLRHKKDEQGNFLYDGQNNPITELSPEAFAHALQAIDEVGLPAVVRPSFTLGGTGGGIAYNREEFFDTVEQGLDASPTNEVLIEESVIGWKEYEMEVIRDRADNAIIVCSIENVDAMGVHTGDSITVAPALTLTDKEYQRMRSAAIAVLREIGVETGGSNVQFAVDPEDGRMVVIEMNPRVSRSSALASKATGFPIAKIAARLAVGYTLDEIANDITRETPASFEPTIDYVVTKVPRWAFEKFPGTTGALGASMQSVGEAMAIGRTFPESLQKALRSLEHGRWGLNCDPGEAALDSLSDTDLVRRASVATPDRPFELEAALRRGIDADRLVAATGVDPWFLDQIGRIVAERQRLAGRSGQDLGRSDWRRAKRLGFGDAQLARLLGSTEDAVRHARLAAGVRPTFKTVDTCGAEFEAATPYHYSTYEDEDEVRPSRRPTVIVLGSGPNRIGQGIEFDYCCVHASFALRQAGYDTVMVNCNPETVSTDYDTSDRLYFEPVGEEEVRNVIEVEQSVAEAGGGVVGVIVGLGGQTPLKLAGRLPRHLVLGTSPDAIDLAEDRERWSALCARLEIPQPAGGTATSVDEALAVIERIGYPALLRPSYVLGGRAMEIVYDEPGLRQAMAALAPFGGPGAAGSLGREGGLSAERPVLVDRFLEDAIEVDVDAVRDRVGEVVIGAVMEHVEEAGVHSGDSACVIPPPTLPTSTVEVIESYTAAIAEALDVRGPINVQYAVKQGQVFVIEANPRASRTVPFVAKATGVPLAKVAARVTVGATLAELRDEGLLVSPGGGDRVSVKEAVLPFGRFPDVDTILGPAIRSTADVIGVDRP